MFDSKVSDSWDERTVLAWSFGTSNFILVAFDMPRSALECGVELSCTRMN